MGLLNWQDFLDNHQFFIFVNIVKCGVTAGNVKPVDYNPASQNKFFLIALASRERIFFKSFKGSFDDPSCLLREAVYLIR